jgi:hypothetical protein
MFSCGKEGDLNKNMQPFNLDNFFSREIPLLYRGPLAGHSYVYAKLIVCFL